MEASIGCNLSFHEILFFVHTHTHAHYCNEFGSAADCLLALAAVVVKLVTDEIHEKLVTTHTVTSPINSVQLTSR